MSLSSLTERVMPASSYPPGQTSAAIEQPSPSSEILLRAFEHDRDARFILDEDNAVEFVNRVGRTLLARSPLGQNRFRQLRFQSSRAQATLESVLAAARKEPDVWHHKVVPLGDGEWTSLYVRCLDGETGYIEITLRSLAGHDPDILPLAETFGLTSMETKVLRGLAQSLCPKRIASGNSISVHTVRAHIRSIYAKLGTRNNTGTQSLILRLIS